MHKHDTDIVLIEPIRILLQKRGIFLCISINSTGYWWEAISNSTPEVLVDKWFLIMGKRVTINLFRTVEFVIRIK